MSTTILPPLAVRHIDSGWYQVSDANAGRLAKASANRRLPRPGYLIDGVTLPDGRKCCLQRTSVQHYTYSPKRGWVWAIYGGDLNA